MCCLVCGRELSTGDDSVTRVCNWCKRKEITVVPGWTCQKCGRSYSPYVDQCHSCNQMIDHIYSGNTSCPINPKW